MRTAFPVSVETPPETIYMPTMTEITFPWKYKAIFMSQESGAKASLLALDLIHLPEQQSGKACFAFPAEEQQHHFRTEH